MTSRERVLLALDHKEADRVPLDFGGHRSSGINVKAYQQLRRHLGLPERELWIYDFVQQLAHVHEDVLDLFGADVLEASRCYYDEPRFWQDFTLDDGTPCKVPAYIRFEKTPLGYECFGDHGQQICIKKRGCDFFEQTYFPYLDRDDGDFGDLAYQLDQIMWCRYGHTPPIKTVLQRGQQREYAKKLRATTDRAIYGIFGGNLVELGEFCFRMDNFLCLMAEDPDRIHAFLDKLLALHMDALVDYLDAVGDCIDVIGFSDDMGMQSGPMFSAAMYREFFQARHKQMWDLVKRKQPHLKIALHCCGGVRPLLNDLIDAGLEAINPVQFICSGMELPLLKREFGQRLTFWGGGCDTRDILPRHSPLEIAEHVQANVALMRTGGGFVFQQVHNIMPEVPPENVVAMLRAVNG